MLTFQSPVQLQGLSLLNVNQSHEIQSSQSSQLLLQALNQFPSQLLQRDQVILQENQKLRNDNQILQQQVNHLENKQQELINEIHDLKQIIKRIYLEEEVSIQYLKTKNNLLEHHNDSLQKALNNLQNNIQMFGQLKELSKVMRQGNDF